MKVYLVVTDDGNRSGLVKTFDHEIEAIDFLADYEQQHPESETWIEEEDAGVETWHPYMPEMNSYG